MSSRVPFCILFAMATLTVPLLTAEVPVPGKNTLLIRGERQDIYVYPAAAGPGTGESGPPTRRILFAPGDGGWRGFAVIIAETVASWGYDVHGLDTKRYLESFTGAKALKEAEVMADFRQIAEWIAQGSGERVILVGWSEGAGLCLLAAAAQENKKIFAGLVTIGLSETSVLGWRWSDILASLAGKDPKEPLFPSADFLPKVAPLPLLMIHSSQDAYVPQEAARHMFSLAGEPKRFVMVQARDHRFDGNQEEFFRSLRDGLQWTIEITP